MHMNSDRVPAVELLIFDVWKVRLRCSNECSSHSCLSIENCHTICITVHHLLDIFTASICIGLISCCSSLVLLQRDVNVNDYEICMVTAVPITSIQGAMV